MIMDLRDSLIAENIEPIFPTDLLYKNNNNSNNNNKTVTPTPKKVNDLLYQYAFSLSWQLCHQTSGLIRAQKTPYITTETRVGWEVGKALWLERRTHDERWFESRQERWENFLLQNQLFVLTLISLSVPPLW